MFPVRAVSCSKFLGKVADATRSPKQRKIKELCDRYMSEQTGSLRTYSAIACGLTFIPVIMLVAVSGGSAARLGVGILALVLLLVSWLIGDQALLNYKHTYCPEHLTSPLACGPGLSCCCASVVCGLSTAALFDLAVALMVIITAILALVAPSPSSPSAVDIVGAVFSFLCAILLVSVAAQIHQHAIADMVTTGGDHGKYAEVLTERAGRRGIWRGPYYGGVVGVLIDKSCCCDRPGQHCREAAEEICLLMGGSVAQKSEPSSSGFKAFFAGLFSSCRRGGDGDLERGPTSSRRRDPDADADEDEDTGSAKPTNDSMVPDPVPYRQAALTAAQRCLETRCEARAPSGLKPSR